MTVPASYRPNEMDKMDNDNSKKMFDERMVRAEILDRTHFEYIVILKDKNVL